MSEGLDKAIPCPGDATTFLGKLGILGHALFATDCDWTQFDLGWMYTLFFVLLGVSAAIWGGWLEKAGPRKAGVVAALCWCGGLMISAVGVEGHAVLIDCRSLDTTAVPLPAGTAVVVLDTSTRRGLVDSAYNERRARCEEAAASFGVRALRDLDADTLALRFDELDPVTARRARHVVTENARTVAAAEAMSDGDAVALGALMDESHTSMRDDFEISSPALAAIV